MHCSNNFEINPTSDVKNQVQGSVPEQGNNNILQVANLAPNIKNPLLGAGAQPDDGDDDESDDLI